MLPEASLSCLLSLWPQARIIQENDTANAPPTGVLDDPDVEDDTANIMASMLTDDQVRWSIGWLFSWLVGRLVVPVVGLVGWAHGLASRQEAHPARGRRAGHKLGREGVRGHGAEEVHTVTEHASASPSYPPWLALPLAGGPGL